MRADSKGSLSESSKQKIFGTIGTLLSVAIFEQRNSAFEIEGLQKLDGNTNIVSTYLAKPYETFCQENVAYIFKHLNETVHQSGISTLFNSQAMHDTHYKHVQMYGYKSDFDGVPHLRLRWKVAYVTHNDEKDKLIAK